MPDILRAYQERAANRGEPGDAIRFIASTSDIARDGMVIEADGWDLDNFRKNPVFLWAHNYSEPPIGHVTSVKVEGKNLVAEVVFDQDDDHAKRIERKYRNGSLNAVSVGFDIKEYAPPKGEQLVPKVTKAELLELSAVPVPADPNALSQLRARAYRSIGRELLSIADDEDADDNAWGGGKVDIVAGTADGKANANGTYREFIVTNKPDPKPSTDSNAARATWDDTARQMVELYRPFAQRPDAERKADYQRVAAAYGKHGKTHPEFKTGAELEALDAETIRGLFIEGEPELFPDVFAGMASRAGAVLSKRNLDDLAKAGTLIAGVIDRATKEAEDQKKTDDERAAEAGLAQIADILKGKHGNG